jgi:hypothetical protein
VGAFISYQQWRIAEIRLRHDTYERKRRIYEAAKALLVVFQIEGSISHETFLKFSRDIADAEFVFNDAAVIQYLQTLREQAIELIRSQKQGAAAADHCAELEQWFIKQFDVLRSKFNASMRLHPPPMAKKIKEWMDAAARLYRRGFGKNDASPIRGIV